MATNLVDEFPDDDFPISFDDYHGIASKFEEEEVFPSTSHTKCPSNEENTNVIPCTSSYNEKLIEMLLAHLDHFQPPSFAASIPSAALLHAPSINKIPISAVASDKTSGVFVTAIPFFFCSL